MDSAGSGLDWIAARKVLLQCRFMGVFGEGIATENGVYRY